MVRHWHYFTPLAMPPPALSYPAEVRASIERLLAGMTGTPAFVRNARMDVGAANNLCFALYADILNPATLPLNLARFMFLDPLTLIAYTAEPGSQPSSLASGTFPLPWERIRSAAGAAPRATAPVPGGSRLPRPPAVPASARWLRPLPRRG